MNCIAFKIKSYISSYLISGKYILNINMVYELFLIYVKQFDIHHLPYKVIHLSFFDVYSHNLYKHHVYH